MESGKTVKITEIMTAPAVTVGMDDSLSVIKEIFDNTQFHHILVVESERLFGVISDRDLLKALSPRIGTASETTSDTALLNKRAHQIMTRNPISLASDADINDAIDIFNNENISCIPIVENSGNAIGIVSWRDILRTLSRNNQR